MRHIGVLARAPSAGGKTRLTAGLSVEDALALRVALLTDTLRVVRSTGVPCTVFFTPDQARDEMVPLVGAGASLVAQAHGDLGARMHAAFGALFAQGVGQVVLTGSDVPTLPVSHVTRAFQRLDEGAHVVLGPAEDGGYYLVGLVAPAPQLFTGMIWGTRDVLARTLERAASVGLRVGFVDPWYDVDTPDGLERVAGGSEPAAQTRGWMATRLEGR